MINQIRKQNTKNDSSKGQFWVYNSKRKSRMTDQFWNLEKDCLNINVYLSKKMFFVIKYFQKLLYSNNLYQSSLNLLVTGYL